MFELPSNINQIPLKLDSSNTNKQSLLSSYQHTYSPFSPKQSHTSSKNFKFQMSTESEFDDSVVEFNHFSFNVDESSQY